jgi:hypothetical protein
LALFEELFGEPDDNTDSTAQAAPKISPPDVVIEPAVPSDVTDADVVVEAEIQGKLSAVLNSFFSSFFLNLFFFFF